MMGLYNFQKRFVPFILSGEKTHTIRADRANPDKPGNKLYLYTGLRTKGAKRLAVVYCVKVEQIRIWREPVELLEGCGDATPFAVSIDGVVLDYSEKEQLARRDGFSSFAEMMTFWDGRLPFRGHIIHWRV